MRKFLAFLALAAVTAATAQKQTTKEHRFQIGLEIKGGRNGFAYIPDLDARLRMFTVSKFNFHLGMSVGLTGYYYDQYEKYSQRNQELVLNPKLVAEFNPDEKYRPYLALGYITWKHDFGDVNLETGLVDLDYRVSGYTVNPGLRYYLAKLFYFDAGVRIAFTKASGPSAFVDQTKNEDTDLMLGVGVRF